MQRMRHDEPKQKHTIALISEERVTENMLHALMEPVRRSRGHAKHYTRWVPMVDGMAGASDGGWDGERLWQLPKHYNLGRLALPATTTDGERHYAMTIVGDAGRAGVRRHDQDIDVYPSTARRGASPAILQRRAGHTYQVQGDTIADGCDEDGDHLDTAESIDIIGSCGVAARWDAAEERVNFAVGEFYLSTRFAAGGHHQGGSDLCDYGDHHGAVDGNHVGQAAEGHGAPGSAAVQDKIVTHFSRPYSMHDLRGGGPRVGAGRPGADRVLGAGVLEWLEDSEYELEEMAESERRRSERMVLREPARSEAPRLPSAPMSIFGCVNGKRVRICPLCSHDVPEEAWGGHVCGMAERGGSVRRLINLWEAIGDREPIVPRQVESPIARPLRELALQAGAELQEDNTSWPCSGVTAGQSEWTRSKACTGCGLSLKGAADGTEWRICRCGLLYCSPCAQNPCLSCPAAAVWDGCAEPEDVVPEGQGSLQRTDCSAADSGDCYTASGPSQGAGAPRVLVAPMSPDGLFEARASMRKEFFRARNEKRVLDRRKRNDQVRAGRRPPRERSQRTEVTFTTVNPTCASALKEELEHGYELSSTHYLFIQEHKLKGAAKSRGDNWARKMGWDCVTDDAYIKDKKEGGGTAIWTRDPQGIRPMTKVENTFLGRASFGACWIDGEVTMCSVYGVSGAGVKGQLRLWAMIMERVKTVGRPFVIGGDWQVTPQEIKNAGFDKVIGGVVCAASGATNLTSKRRIDFFVISHALLQGGWTARVHHGCNIATHAPVSVTIRAGHCEAVERRLATPKPLPIHPLVGPRQKKTGVDWGAWEAIDAADRLEDFDEAIITRAAQTWYAGAEQELLERFDLECAQEGDAYRGLGLVADEIEGSPSRRFRNSSSRLGLLGQRLGWACKALHLVQFHGRAVLEEFPVGEEHEGRRPGSEGVHHTRREAAIGVLRSIGHRARSLYGRWGKDYRQMTGGDGADSSLPEDQRCVMEDARAAAARGLRTVSWLVVVRRGRPPLLDRLCNGRGGETLEGVQTELREVARSYEALSRMRHKVELREVRRWVRAAPLGLTHKVTKEPEDVAKKTASATKGHVGERTPQIAADKGRAEWGKLRNATDHDESEEIIRAVDALMAIGRREADLEELLLPQLDDDRIGRAARTFGEGTGIGVDSMRPRQVADLSRGGRHGLCRLLHTIEKFRRWPECMREIIEVALGKKSGGSRLIGLATAVYRIWARARYLDCRAIMEARVERPFLAAAPRRGARVAATDQAWGAEAAWAKGETAATTIIDFKSFYEFIDVAELADGSKQYGMPSAITSLIAHLYTGPRRIRVDGVVSARSFPKRSVLAGCTWATLIVRLIMIKPAERLLEAIKRRAAGWDIGVGLVVYIDDGAVTTRGRVDAVSFIHNWITRLVITWVKSTLRKKIAEGKMACVASTGELRKRLTQLLKGTGCKVTKECQFLGTDYAAGGPIRDRKAHLSRRRMARRRKARIGWLRRMGGRAGEVVRGGTQMSELYGAETAGLNPASMRNVRMMMGSVSKVRAGGASLTVKLALGGHGASDADPLVTHGNTALDAVTAKLWDEPRSRRGLVPTWRKYVDVLGNKPPREQWLHVHGPVGAAMVQLHRIGGDWMKPYAIQLLGCEIDLLNPPLRLVSRIVKEQARLHLDRKLLERLCESKSWDWDAVKDKYEHGIDWEAIRAVLNSHDLTDREKHALRIVTHGAFWSDARRWIAGMVGHGSCTSCHAALGDDVHMLHQCEAVHQDLLEHRLLGRIGRKLPVAATSRGMEPLLCMGLPPRITSWQPEEMEFSEGGMDMRGDDELFGDGSGYCQRDRDARVATWSLLRLRWDQDDWQKAEAIRGNVPGWDRTVPRAELTAYNTFLKHAGPGSTFIGDCKGVIDAATDGVPLAWTCSRNPNADLWREARRLQGDHDTLPAARKVTAHRSRRRAADEGEVALRWWKGNHEADSYAKSLAKAAVEADGLEEASANHRADMTEVLKRVAIGAARQLRQRPAEAGTSRRKTRCNVSAGDGDADVLNHDIVARVNGGWECKSCKGFAASQAGLRTLRKKPCVDVETGQIHGTHLINVTGGITWCGRCGCYTSRWPRELRAPCRGFPASEAQSNVKRRLEKGLAPTTASYLNDIMEAEKRYPGGPDHGGEEEARGQRGSRRRGVSQTVGRYLRLPGGPLARDQPVTISRDPQGYSAAAAEASSSTSSASVIPSAARCSGSLFAGVSAHSFGLHDHAGEFGGRAGGNVPSDIAATAHFHHDTMRRRIRGKSAPPLALHSPHHAQSGVDLPRGSPWCSPPSGVGWTRRLHCSSSAGAAACHRCSGPTRATCKGCHRNLCMRCARAATQCMPMSP